MRKDINNINYVEKLRNEMKEAHGRQWGLYFHNATKKAEAYIKYAEKEITRDLKFVPKDLLGFVAYGVYMGNQKYIGSASQLKDATEEKRQRIIDMQRTKKLANEFDKDIVEYDEETKTRSVILSPKTLNDLYKRNKISREEWLKGLNDFKEYRKSTQEYVYRGY